MDPRWNRAANAVEAALLRFRGAVINASTACRCGHDGKANFNPAQPRDEFGRWTDAGSGWSAPIDRHDTKSGFRRTAWRKSTRRRWLAPSF